MRLILTMFFAALVLAPTGDAATKLDLALVRGINAVRAEHGLKPLVTSARLTAPAVQHTREMGMNGYFEHESLDASPFWKRIQRWYPSSGWSCWGVGENLLWTDGNVTATDAVAMWMASPEHRANVLSRKWREIGISAAQFDSAPGEFDGASVTIVTADFGYRR